MCLWFLFPSSHPPLPGYPTTLFLERPGTASPHTFHTHFQFQPARLSPNVFTFPQSPAPRLILQHVHSDREMHTAASGPRGGSGDEERHDYNVVMHSKNFGECGTDVSTIVTSWLALVEKGGHACGDHLLWIHHPQILEQTRALGA